VIDGAFIGPWPEAADYIAEGNYPQGPTSFEEQDLGWYHFNPASKLWKPVYETDTLFIAYYDTGDDELIESAIYGKKDPGFRYGGLGYLPPVTRSSPDFVSWENANGALSRTTFGMPTGLVPHSDVYYDLDDVLLSTIDFDVQTFGGSVTAGHTCWRSGSATVQGNKGQYAKGLRKNFQKGSLPMEGYTSNLSTLPTINPQQEGNAFACVPDTVQVDIYTGDAHTPDYDVTSTQAGVTGRCSVRASTSSTLPGLSPFTHYGPCYNPKHIAHEDAKDITGFFWFGPSIQTVDQYTYSGVNAPRFVLQKIRYTKQSDAGVAIHPDQP
jgi:hypothetical protein